MGSVAVDRAGPAGKGGRARLHIVACKGGRRRAVFRRCDVRGGGVGDRLDDETVGRGGQQALDCDGRIARPREHLQQARFQRAFKDLVFYRAFDHLPGKRDGVGRHRLRRHIRSVQRRHIHRLRRLLSVQHLDDAEADVLISACGVAAFPAIFRAAVRPFRGPRAALDGKDSRSVALRAHGGRPFPDVAPEIHRPMRAPCHVGILLDRRPAVAYAAVEIGVLRHVSGRQLPLALAR